MTITTGKDNWKADTAALRKQAEEKAARSSENWTMPSPEEIQQTLHELRVHQIELEMQNEELRQTQTDLCVAKARYFDLYDLAPVGYCTISEKGLILEANLTAANLLGVARGALIRHSLTGFIHKEDQDIYYRHCKRLFESEKPMTWEMRMVKKDGTAFWAGLDATAAQDDNGEFVCRFVMKDVTGRKRVEEALMESEERYRTLFEDAKDGIALADGETGRLIECNQALCRMVERDKKELIGQVQSILHPPQPFINGKTASFVNNKSDDSGTVLEERLISKTAGLIPVEIKATRVRMHDHDYLLGIFRDISERKLLEKEKTLLNSQLFQAQKMEAVGALAGGVAHDFNNLLTAISGFIWMAMMKLEDSNPIYRDLQQANLAAVRAGGVVRQLLLFSRKQPMEPAALNLNDIVTNLLKMLNRLIGEDVSIIIELAPDLWAIQGDVGNIEQVIMNLVVNARDAMPRGGKVTIGSENVNIDGEYCARKSNARPGMFSCLTITDTGTGMDAATLEHIFEPFFTTKAKDKGTGLGLSVVYGIVKQNNGWIEVESECGRGTTFKIYLPSTDKKMVLKTNEVFRIENYQGAGKRVLVVEDHDLVRELAIDVLKENGYTVFYAENANKARELFTSEKGDFDLVFSDIVLPDMSGIRLVEELSSGRKLRVLLCSGYTDDKAELQIIIERKHRFLQKPYSVQSLLMAVRETLEST